MKDTMVRVVDGGPFGKPIEAFEPVCCPPDHPRLKELRDRYKLRAVAGEGDDFARARRMMHWVRGRWDHGYDHAKVRDLMDAVTLIEAGKRGLKFSCGNYAQTFVQCCLSVGLVARRCDLKVGISDFPHGREGNYGHMVSEAYCRELGKWVLFDCDLNAFYTIDGIPAGALDLHRSWHEHRGANAEQVLDEPHFVKIVEHFEISRKQMEKNWRDFNRHRTIDFYHHLRTHTVNGWSGKDSDAPRDMTLGFCGLVHPLIALGFKEGSFGGPQTAREDQFNWPVDRTYMRARMLGDRPTRRVELTLEHTMPQFDHFELAVGREPFRRVRGDAKTLTAPVGRTTLRARCVDVWGGAGHEARLLLTAKA